MAPEWTHASVGMAVYRAAGWRGLPLAAWTHVALDDLNWGQLVWYHELGTAWRYPVGVGANIALMLGVAFVVWRRPRLWPGALAGVAADLEHVLCWTLFQERHAQGLHWLHDAMFSPVLSTEWGLLAWAGVGVAVGLMLWGLLKNK